MARKAPQEDRQESDGPTVRPVALVTGAAIRVGRAIALELARAGHDLVIHFRTSAAQAEEVASQCVSLGVHGLPLQADLTRPDEVERLFERIDAAFGRLDVLVNSAAVFRCTPAWDLSDEDLDLHLDVNLKAPYRCAVLASRRMRHRGGCIVNIADVAAERPFRDHVPYCVSKAALVMMTRSMAKAYAPRIRVNAVSPGTVLFREDEDEDLRRRVIARIPLGRVGSAEDVARAVRFLVESPHITGAILPVDGGRSLA